MSESTSSTPSHASSASWTPTSVGIKAIEIYVPNNCVEQTELEKHDGVSEGKYTIGLGQTRMGFCNDREDIYSITLTAVSSLLKKYNINPSNIGRLEVGTETLLDKSKSVKSVLMQLFSQPPYNNYSIEGVDNINACYGGTNALLNAVNWVESSAWDGRDAIVVAGDIAVYSKGAARPTGGAGAVAMLVGPDAPIKMVEGLRGSCMDDVYDFYKPDMTSEYPLVQGQLSIECYTRALDSCYKTFKERERILREKRAASRDSKRHQKHNVTLPFTGAAPMMNEKEELQKTGEITIVGADGEKVMFGEEKQNASSIPLTVNDRFDYMAFHAPTTKLVSKSYARLHYNDYKSHPDHPSFDGAVDPSISEVSYEDSLKDRNVEKTFMTLSKDSYNNRVKPSTLLPTMCGNMYTASLYSSLCSLIASVQSEQLFGKTIGCFSYGSGMASTLFALKVVGDTQEMKEKLDLFDRLESRNELDPEDYDQAMELREEAHMKKDFEPVGKTSGLKEGTYYLKKVDDMYRREYAVV